MVPFRDVLWDIFIYLYSALVRRKLLCFMASVFFVCRGDSSNNFVSDSFDRMNCKRENFCLVEEMLILAVALPRTFRSLAPQKATITWRLSTHAESTVSVWVSIQNFQNEIQPRLFLRTTFSLELLSFTTPLTHKQKIANEVLSLDRTQATPKTPP